MKKTPIQTFQEPDLSNPTVIDQQRAYVGSFLVKRHRLWAAMASIPQEMRRLPVHIRVEKSP